MVEVVSGKPFDEFLAERIFRPLKMADTTFHPVARTTAAAGSSVSARRGRQVAGPHDALVDRHLAGQESESLRRIVLDGWRTWRGSIR